MAALEIALAPAMARRPRAAALRVPPFFAARTAATVNHSTLWFAAVDRAFISGSAGLGGHPEMVREMARSTSLTRPVERRSREIHIGPLGSGRTRGGAGGAPGPSPPPPPGATAGTAPGGSCGVPRPGTPHGP